jgi:SAM-dependent methyltransferase
MEAPPPDTFDWLLSLRSHPQLRAWLLPSAHGFSAEARVLVVGCGDSTLSEDLWESGFPNVVGIDIEERCISAARARTAGKAGLAWEKVDLTASSGLSTGLGAFQLALDKGTLDAIVCEGDDAACRACWGVRTALAPSGVLVVVTLHRDGTVQRFLDAPALGFATVEAHELNVAPVFDGKVIVCSLASGTAAQANTAAQADTYAAYRAQVEATPYEDATQLLTPEREASLRLHFAMRVHAIDDGGAQAGVRLADAYALIFLESERTEYALADFAQDAAEFDPALAQEDAIWTADDALRFLRTMQ